MVGSGQPGPSGVSKEQVTHASAPLCKQAPSLPPSRASLSSTQSFPCKHDVGRLMRDTAFGGKKDKQRKKGRGWGGELTAQTPFPGDGVEVALAAPGAAFSAHTCLDLAQIRRLGEISPCSLPGFVSPHLGNPSLAQTRRLSGAQVISVSLPGQRAPGRCLAHAGKHHAPHDPTRLKKLWRSDSVT